MRLLTEARYASPGEPIHTAVFDGQGLPRVRPGRKIPGKTQARGTWLQTAERNEAEIKQIEALLYQGIEVPGWR